MATAVDLTLSEAVTLLVPALTEQQLRQIITALGWQPAGRRRTGHTGRPHHTYDFNRILSLHAAIAPFIGGQP